MKRILYLVPLILLGSCKQTKFICNQQLVLQQQTLATASPDISKIVGKDNIRTLYETEVNAVKPISSEKKKESNKYNKSRQIFDRFLPKINHPKDTLINDPGLKKAKDALDIEEKWLKAFFIFFGIGIFVALAFFGIIPLALGIGEDLLLYILFGAFIGYSITYYGIIIIFLLHIGVYRNYKEEKDKHLKYVLGFFLLPALILALLFLLIL